MKRSLIFTLLAVLACYTASAQVFSVNRVAYTVTDAQNRYVSISGFVTGCTTLDGSSTVEYNGVIYTVKEIEPSAFRSCTSLLSAIIPNSVTSIGSYAFRGCTSLTSIDVPNSVTSIGDYAFNGCTSLTSIDIPNSVTSIGSYAFNGCTGLTSIDIPNSVTSIGDYAFWNCSCLTSVNIPNSVISIGDNAFVGCSLYLFTIESTQIPLTSNTWGLTNNTTIIVPDATLADYLTTDGWKDLSIYIIAQSTQTDYNIEVQASESTSSVQHLIGESNVGNVVRLKVRGSFNGYDVMVFRNKMPNLHFLDLSEADIKGCDYEYYTGCKMTADNVLGNNAFYGLNKLIEVKLPETMTAMGEYCFYGCTNLKEVTVPTNVGSIGRCAFYDCRALRGIVLPTALDELLYRTFYDCRSLQSVAFPSGLKSIGPEAFYNCFKLEVISLPPIVTQIEGGAFGRCTSLRELRIPSSVTSIGNNAFSNCNNLNDIYTYTVEPTSIDQNTFSTWTTATLHIPEFSHDNYYWDTQWSQFLTHVDFNEPYQYFYINNDYTLDDQTGRIDGVTDEQTGDVTPPDADLNEGSGLIVVGNEDQDLGDVHHHHDADGNGASIIDDGNVTARNLIFDIKVQKNRWYFFSFPFNVLLENISAPGAYVFRQYDGLWRALHGSGGWKDLDANETTLYAGKGYIFQCAANGTLSITVPNPNFKGAAQQGDWLHQLAEYVSEAAANAGWNFIGNPCLSYYDLDHVDYDGPVTCWNGSSYEAVRPGDDDYFFHPFEAFFVQKPDNDDQFGFERDHRETYQQSQRSMERKQTRRRLMAVDESRLLVNLELTDGNTTDKTRVVFNDSQLMTYEATCDAAKFMANGVPQLFSLEPSGEAVRYAINERPMDNGTVRLGYTAVASGELVINARRMDTPMMLQDLKTGMLFDLSEGSYCFVTEAGTFNDRFLLVRKSDVTGINETLTNSIWNDDKPVFNTAGQRVNPAHMPAGVVIVGGKKVLNP